MNTKKTIRQDKKMLLCMFLLPLLLAPFLCYFFSAIYIENVPFGIADLDNSLLSRTIVQGFENDPGFAVNYYANSEEELQNAIDTKKISGGVIIPKNYSADLSLQKAPKILVIVNGTNTMIANNAAGYAGAVLGTFNAYYQMNVLEGSDMVSHLAKQTVTTFSIGERILYDPQLSYMCYLLYIVVPLIVQLFYLLFYLMPLLIKEKKNNDWQKMTFSEMLQKGKSLLPRLVFMWLTICVSSDLGLWLSHLLFGLPVRGSTILYFVLMILFQMCLTAMGIVLASFLNEKTYTYFVEFYMIINVLFVFTSGAVWPEYMMPHGFLAPVRMLWPYIHFAGTLKALNLKGVGLSVLWPDILGGVCFLAAWMLIGAAVWRVKARRPAAHLPLAL